MDYHDKFHLTEAEAKKHAEASQKRFGIEFSVRKRDDNRPGFETFIATKTTDKLRKSHKSDMPSHVKRSLR